MQTIRAMQSPFHLPEHVPPAQGTRSEPCITRMVSASRQNRVCLAELAKHRLSCRVSLVTKSQWAALFGPRGSIQGHGVDSRPLVSDPAVVTAGSAGSLEGV